MKGYLVGLTAAAILAALIRRLAPKGIGGQGARLGAGLLVLTAMLSPLGNLDLTAGAVEAAKRSYTGVMEADDLELETNRRMEALITDAAEAYILDKAQAMDLPLEAEVTLRLQDRYPVPWSVVLRGAPTEAQRQNLEQTISQDLGIPPERQEWCGM